MTNKPPLMELDIPTADRGFYSGFAKSVAIPSKLLVSALIVWAIALPQNAETVLNAAAGALLHASARPPQTLPLPLAKMQSSVIAAAAST